MNVNGPTHLHRIILFVLAVLCCTASHGQVPAPSAATAAAPATVTPPPRESIHVYVLMGQSNMAGRDARNLPPPLNNPRVLALNAEGQWVLAREPLHPLHGRTEAGVGPGIPFALDMLKADPNVTIGLVPCAVGGTELRRWVKGGDLYEKAVRRAKTAAEAGVIKGVLWHQGESDTRDRNDAETYEARLTKMFKDLRADLGQPDLPIVVGQLGEFLEPEKWPYADTVRAAIKQVPEVVPHVGYADSHGLGDKGDKLHFSADAQTEFGARYAKAMQALQSPAAIDVWPEGKMPGRGAKEPEAEMPSKDQFHRITNISRPALTLFPAPKKDASSPAMIVCPGGAYNHLVIDKEGTEIAAWLNSLGVSALVLKYRVPENRAGALQDIQRALSLTRAHAAEWGIDPRRLGVIGFSAGGNLAAKASTLFDRRSYPAIDDVDQQSCRPDYAVLVYPAYLDDGKGKLSADLNLTPDIPPTLIVHNEDDQRYVRGSKLYDAALREVKVPHEFVLYQTDGHGYGLHCTKEARAWPQAAAEWLHKTGVQSAPSTGSLRAGK